MALANHMQGLALQFNGFDSSLGALKDACLSSDSPAPVAEPGVLLLTGSALLGLALVRSRKRG